MVKTENKVKDLTEGSTAKVLISFAIPILLSDLFNDLYNILDSVIVGRVLGTDALAAIGTTSALVSMILGFIRNITRGSVIPIAQSFGAKDYKKTKELILNLAVISIILSIIITLCFSVFINQILILINTPYNIYIEARKYIMSYIISIPFIIIFYTSNEILRSLGVSKPTMVIMIISSIINITFDLLFVSKLGVLGAGIASLIAMIFQSITTFIVCKQRVDELKIDKNECKVNTNNIIILLKYGIPFSLQNILIQLGNNVMQSSVNSLGSNCISAKVAAQKIMTLLESPFISLFCANISYTGQNRGASKLDNVKNGTKQMIKISIIYSILTLITVLVLKENMFKIFLNNPEQEVLQMAYQATLYNTLMYWLFGLFISIRSTMQGLGNSIGTILTGLGELIGRVAASLIIIPILGYTGYSVSSPIAWTCALIFVIPCYIKSIKELKI